MSSPMGIFSKHEKPVAPVAATVTEPATPPGHVAVTFNVPWATVEAKLPAAAAVLSKQRPLQGFREGKVPVEVARQRYGDQLLMAEAFDLAVPSLYAAAITTAGHETIGQPAMTFEPQPTWGVDVTITATAPVLPSVILPDWTKVRVDAVQRSVSDAGVQKVVDQIRDRFAVEEPADRPAASNDLVELDYELLVDGVVMEGGSGKGHRAVLGRGHLLPEIESAVIGMNAGQEKQQSITFGPEHQLKIVAGKTADCHIVLKQVFSRSLPELTDELAAKIGPFKTADEFVSRVKADLEAESTAEAKRETERAALQAAISAAKFDALPDILINDEVNRLLHELHHSVERYNVKFEDYLLHIKKSLQELRLEFVAPATERLKVTLLLRAIVRERNIAPTDAEVDTEVVRLKAQVQHPERLDSQQVRTQVRADLAQRAAVDWVVRTVTNSKSE